MSKITGNTSVGYEITLESVPPADKGKVVIIMDFRFTCYKSIHWHSKRSPFVVPSGKSLHRRQRGLLTSVDDCNMLMAKVFGCTLM